MASSSSMGADLGTVLAQLLVPVNETRRHAEERFKVRINPVFSPYAN